MVFFRQVLSFKTELIVIIRKCRYFFNISIKSATIFDTQITDFSNSGITGSLFDVNRNETQVITFFLPYPNVTGGFSALKIWFPGIIVPLKLIDAPLPTDIEALPPKII